MKSEMYIIIRKKPPGVFGLFTKRAVIEWRKKHAYRVFDYYVVEARCLADFCAKYDRRKK